jgi:NAD(P)H-hydrate epimerase
MKVCSVAEMRKLDRTAIDKYGIPEEILMENAGLAAYSLLQEKVGIRGKHFLVICGAGHNGGDGLVVARKVLSNGGLVKVYILGDPAKFDGPAKLNYEIITHLPVEVQSTESIEPLKIELAHCDVVVDAIFGTGLIREVNGLYRQVIEAINASGKLVLSIDIPSGVNGDTGRVMGAAVKAGFTITFGLPKFGNIFFPGYDLGGELYVSHISLPPSMYDAETFKVGINSFVKLPSRERDAYKGSVGKALVIAGAANYFGAPYFAALSFLKAGGGYSRLAAPATMIPFIASRANEVVFIPQKETVARSIALENKAALLELAETMDIVILGQGMSLEQETQELVRELTREISRPLIIDGDGITAISKDLQVIKNRRAETIITPHPAEMSRITGTSISEIDVNRIEILQQTCKKLNASIVLKFAHSLIGYPDGQVLINMGGNPGMATAGSGDSLTGTIAAMYGLGMSLQQAVSKGVFLHSLAGDLAADAKGEDGMTAQDVLDYLPLAVKKDREGLIEERYFGLQVI